MSQFRKILLFGLVVSLQVIYIFPNNFSSKAQNIPDLVSTNQKSINVQTRAERLSDVELNIKFSPYNFVLNKPMERYEDVEYKLFLNLNEQSYSQNINLERKIYKNNIRDDEDSNCMKINGLFRYGICNDGIYQIDITSTDAAGNKSNVSTKKIIRDTVSPMKADVEKIFLCEMKICISMKGEKSTEIFLNDQSFGEIQDSYKSYEILHSWQYDKDYTFEIILKDKAGNISEKLAKTFHTPVSLDSNGALDGATEENPYSDKSPDDLETPQFDVNINYGKDYTISNIQIPAPLLTLIYTRYDQKVDIYGLARNKELKFNVNVKVKYMTYNEASEKCNLGFIPTDDQVKCVEDMMGIEFLNDWNSYISIQCTAASFLPLGFQSCLLYKKANWRTPDHEGTKEIKIDHALINLYNDKNMMIGQLWNDSSDGKFKYTRNLDSDVKVGDNINATLTIFGDFYYSSYHIDYRGTNLTEATKNAGLTSPRSNSLRIDDSEYVSIDGVEAKVLKIPYINQYLEPDGTYTPANGWMMCGAASSVMIAGYFDKLSYDKSNEHDLKRYMYKDEGQGLSDACGPDTGGAYAMTNYQCGGSAIGNIREYLRRHGFESRFLSGQSWVYNDSLPRFLNFNEVKNSIDNNHPIIFSTIRTYPNGSEADHIFVIKGYTSDGRVVANDSFQDMQENQTIKYSYDGKDAIYIIDFPNWRQNYAIEFYQ